MRQSTTIGPLATMKPWSNWQSAIGNIGQVGCGARTAANMVHPAMPPTWALRLHLPDERDSDERRSR
jgi:hypothetical protein